MKLEPSHAIRAIALGVCVASCSASDDAPTEQPEISAVAQADIGAGFEGYMVDYRRSCQSCYLPDGDSVTLDMRPSAGAVAAVSGRGPGGSGRNRAIAAAR